MKMYRVVFDKIEEMEVVKETPKTVQYRIDGTTGKEYKETPWYSWHHTKAEAKEWLIQHKRQTIENARARLEGLHTVIAAEEQKLEKLLQMNIDE